VFGKTSGVIIAVGMAAYAAGVFDARYSRDVQQPLPVVMALLRDADIRNEPGSPGTDPSRSGGVLPMITTETTSDSIVWTVRSGNRTATTMTAKLSPISDGRGTRVVASVERGDAPDDVVSPAFRSEGLTMALFGGMIESRLNEFTAHKARTASPSGSQERSMANGIRTIMQVNAAHGEYMRTGRDPFAQPEFKSPESHMDGVSASHDRPASAKPTRIQPMVDVSRYNR